MRSIKTTCSGCSAELTITGEWVRTVIPSNGKRGSLHQPAYRSSTRWFFLSDPKDSVIGWDCPACGYADSYDMNA